MRTIFTLLAIAYGSFAAFAQEAPKVLPFQGRLTDAQGAPVADGSKLILFEIYDVPTGGNAVWPGELHKTTVNGGLVNVLLGSKSPFGASSPDFNKTLYLQITIDSNGDNAITSADPPLLPRQVILPAVFAKEAADSRKLGGHPADQLPGLLPPGALIPFAGPASVDQPAGFLPCDGRLVLIEEHPRLFAAIGTTYGGDGTKEFKLPDFRGRVAAGLDSAGTNSANRLTSAGSGIDGKTLGATGGAETHTLSAAQSGLPVAVASANHTHPAGGLAAAVSIGAVPSAAAVIRRVSTPQWTTTHMLDLPGYGKSSSETTGAAVLGNTGDPSAATAAMNASSAHPVAQPTIVVNYIIKY